MTLRITTVSLAFAALAALVPSTAQAGAIDTFELPSFPLFVEKPAAVAVTPAPIPGGDQPIETLAVTAYRDVDPTFSSYGVDTGDQAADVPLVGLDGVATSSTAAVGDKPTLFVAVSLTCPIARASMPQAEALAARFADDVDLVFVYVVEAHPVYDPSPYVGAAWPSELNDALGIHYRQPTTLGERVAMAEQLVAMTGVSSPLLVDGASNAWWNTFGPAPNNAVLVSPDGVVLASEGWFNGDGRSVEGALTTLYGPRG